MGAHVRQQLVFDALRGLPQRQFAQRRQIARLEVMPDRPLGLLRNIHLAFVQAVDQIVGREIDDLDVVRCFENAVGYGFAHADARDAGDDVVQALDMLDVERCEDIDAGGDQLLDIKIALGMTASRRVAVRQLVDQHELRATLEDRVEVHFGEAVAFVVDLAAGNDFEAGEQRLGLATTVGFDDTNNDIDPLAPLRLRRKQHLVGLADAGRCAEKNLEAPAAFLLGRVEQCLR